MELTSGVNEDTVALAWLVDALEQVRSQGQTRLVDYLQAISDDMVFEVEMAARRASLLSKLIQDKTA